MKDNFAYTGLELELFKHASCWKSYCGGMVKKFIGQNILEVGAGIGGSSQFLYTGKQKRWVMLEPDCILFEKLKGSLDTFSQTVRYEVINGTIADLTSGEKFDTIIYFDVLEHIEDDKREIFQVEHFLASGGFLIVIVPAHQWLFSPFDKAIGHYRRYSRKDFSTRFPDDLLCVDIKYMDSIGVGVSLSNKLLFRQSAPHKTCIQIWDRCLVPLSKLVDPLVGYKIGRTIIGIWVKK